MKSRKCILLVEDDFVDAMTVKKVFGKLDISNPLHICGNGEEGITWLYENRFNLPGLILLDLNMPKMNGLEFLKEIKSDPDFKMIPVIVLTTSAEERDRVESFNHSVAGYMLKPYKYGEFVEMVQYIRAYWEKSELAY